MLKKIKCLRSLDCLESDYIFQLRYSQSEYRVQQSINVARTSASVRANSHLPIRSQSERLDEEHAQAKRMRTFSASTATRDHYNLHSLDEEEEFRLVDSSFKKKSTAISKKSSRNEFRKESVDTTLSNPLGNRCCSFLFSNQQNDFFLSESRKSKLNKSKKQTTQKRTKDQSNNDLNDEINKLNEMQLKEEISNTECNQIKQQTSIDESIKTCKCNGELLLRSNSN